MVCKKKFVLFVYYIHDYFKLSSVISNHWFGCIQRMAVTPVLQPGKKSDIRLLW